MAINYPSIAAGALDALIDAGQAVTLHKPGTAGGYVPGVGVVPDIPAQNHPGIGALVGYKQNLIDGARILQGDQQLLLAPQIEVGPVAGDTVTAGDATYNVVRVQRVAPAGVTVLYKLQLRGA